jgi:hypothetical protein
VISKRDSVSAPTALDLVQSLVSRLQDMADDPALGVKMAEASVDIKVGWPGDADGVTVQLSIARNRAAETAAGLAASDGGAQLEFNVEGHHVIAMIAQRDLETEAPDVAAVVQRILEEGDRTIGEAATFPDDIRNSHPETKPFHFVDIPFEENGPARPPLPAAPHVLSKIEDFSRDLADGNATAQKRVDTLSWLIHLFGDIHQPLHCIERISELHPGGDRGGNSFRLRGPKRNLHSLWDSAVNVSAPLSEDQLRDEIMETHPRRSLAADLRVTSHEVWARRSHALARTHAYSLHEDPDNPPRPSAAYVRQMETVGRRQAALAGYRLADHLLRILRTTA